MKIFLNRYVHKSFSKASQTCFSLGYAGYIKNNLLINMNLISKKFARNFKSNL